MKKNVKTVWRDGEKWRFAADIRREEKSGIEKDSKGHTFFMMKKETVVICIGSDKVSGDMLGPLVGSALRDEYDLPCPVYGAVGESVNGVNLDSYVRMIERRHKGAALIAVDAALGKEEDVGKIRLKRGGVKAGGAMARKSDPVGDLGIVGIVAKESAPKDVVASLLAVPFELVESLAQGIAKVICLALSQGENA